MSEEALLLIEMHIEQGRPDRAWDEVGPLLAARPSDPELLLLAARAALGTGRADEALRLVEGSLGHRPAEARAHAVRAIALSRLGRRRPALLAAQQAVVLCPQDWRMHAVVISVETAGRGVTRRSIEAAAEALRLAPHDADVQHLAGVVESRRSLRRAHAKAHYEAALRLDPGHEGARDGLARLGLARLDLRGGVETATSLLAAAPGDAVGMDLLRATWHRVVWLLCLAPFLVSQISRIALQGDLHDPRAAAEARPVVLVLLLLLLPAAGVWAWTVHRKVPGGLPRVMRILPVTYPAQVVCAACAVVAAVICVIAAGQRVSDAVPSYSIAALLSVMPGLALVALEQRRRRRRG